MNFNDIKKHDLNLEDLKEMNFNDIKKHNLTLNDLKVMNFKYSNEIKKNDLKIKRLKEMNFNDIKKHDLNEINIKIKELEEINNINIKNLEEINRLREIKENKIINSIRPVYFTLGKLSENKRKEFKNILNQKILSFKNLYKNLQLKTQRLVDFPDQNFIFNNTFNKKFNFYYLYRNIPNKMFLKKFSNILMIHGKRAVSMRLLLKLFEILKLKFKMSDPILFFKFFIFKNLVPVIKSKTVGFKKKKVLGISLSIYKRIGMTLKFFIKGAKMYNYPIIFGLLIEFLKLMKNKSYLQINNKKVISDIKTFKLYKYLHIQPNNILPEQKLLTSVLFKNKKLILLKSFKNFSFLKLMKIDWLNFDKIYDKLIIINNNNRIIRQDLVLKAIKKPIIEQYLSVKEQYHYFKKALKFYLHDAVSRHLTKDDFKKFFKDKNPNNFDLDFDFRRFKNNYEISNIFKTFFVWRYKPKYYYNKNDNDKEI